MQKDNVTQVLKRLVHELAIPVTNKTIEDELQLHPNYNSLRALSDVLNTWRVSNAAYNLNFNELLEAEITDAFIVYTKKGFLMVAHLNKDHAVVSNENWNNHKLPIEDFKNMYSGSILVAEKQPDSGEVDYKIKAKQEFLESLRLPVVVTLSIVILLSIVLKYSGYAVSFNCQLGLLTVFKTAGLFTAILLLIQSFDKNNPLAQILCGGDANKNCNAILSSKAAKVTDNLSWSEVGFFYFAGTWIVLLFNSGNIAILQILAILNILSLPYTFYSIHYQWKVAKQWCVLCCTIQVLLWMEFFAFLPAIINGIQTQYLTGWSNLIICMAIPVLAWVFIKPYLLLSKQIDSLKYQLRNFKYSTELFEKLLNENAKFGLPAEENSLIIGNRQAENIITMVSNPYCQPCAKAHKGLQWLEGRDDIKLQVIFSTANNENDPKTQVATHLLSLQKNRDDRSLRKALDDWYEQKQKNYDAWAKDHPFAEKDKSTHSLKLNQDWCDMTEVTSTPTLFINGRRLPDNYRPEDIKYFI